MDKPADENLTRHTMVASPSDVGETPKNMTPGTRLGRYVVVERIGQGGMGSVYRAYDPELDRRVAIKMLHFDRPIQRDEAQNRLLREAQAMAKLSHPNVVGVFDVGTVGTDVFVAMEFVEGKTLKGWLQKQRSRYDILNVFAAAGRGLAAAHAAGLVHRDFKPANVVVGDDERVRVLDFGLVRSASPGDIDAPTPPRTLREPEPPPVANPSGGLRDSTPSNPGGLLSSPLTLIGSVMGTPGYMAPEQHLAQEVGPAADQFSFAVALYEALYRELPFGYVREDLKHRVLKHDISPPPKDATVPTWLRRVLLRALSPEPQNRYRSMTELLHALATDPIARRRRRLTTGVVGLLVAFVTLATARFATQVPDCALPDAPSDLWGTAQKAALEKSFLDSGAPSAIGTVPRVMAGLNDYTAQLQAAAQRACRETKVERATPANLYARRRVCIERGWQALEMLVQALTESPETPTVVIRAVDALGSLPPVDACHDLVAMEAAPEVPEDAHLAATRGALQQVATLTAVGRDVDAHHRLAALRTKLGLNPPPGILAKVTWLSAQIQMQLGDPKGARTTAEDAMEQASLAGNDALVAQVMFWYFETADGPATLRDWESDLRLAAGALGHPPETQGRYLLALGIHARLDGRDADAENHLTQAVEHLTEEGGPRRALERARWEFSNVLARLGKQREAEKIAEALLQTAREVYGFKHPRAVELRSFRQWLRAEGAGDITPTPSQELP